jgi:hypothetical protein
MNRGCASGLLAIVAFSGLMASAVPAAEQRAPAVTAIYPSGDKLPANHLKFYIHFSQPMRQGVFLEHCALLDDADKPVPEPFRETELWNADRTRLTLWLHPGRQKTGVNLNDDFGPVLQPNRRYTLVVSTQWPSEEGAPLEAAARKSFATTERATGQLDVTAWRLAPPAAGTTAPLTLRFPAPLDHALLLRHLRVVDSTNAPVNGKVVTIDHEQGWSFAPANPWTDKPHRLLVDSILEDLAGNSLARPFEVDLQAPAPKAVPPVVDIPFHPAEKPR